MDRTVVDQLYGAPLSEFVSRRDALAKELRGEDRTLAAELKKLKKPSVGAWALNQLVRGERTKFPKWISAVEKLQQAQVGLLSGEADAAAVRSAQERERAAMLELREAASGVLEEGGHSGAIAMIERVVRTFRGAVLDPEARPLLDEGRLTDELEEPGFDTLLAGMAAVPGWQPRPLPDKAKVTQLRAVPEPDEDEEEEEEEEELEAPAPKSQAKKSAAKKSDAKERAARAKEVERERELRRKLQAQIAELRDAIKEAREERTTAKAEAGRAKTASERARRAAEEAIAKAEEAEGEARRAAAEAERAEAKLVALETELAELKES